MSCCDKDRGLSQCFDFHIGKICSGSQCEVRSLEQENQGSGLLESSRTIGSNFGELSCCLQCLRYDESAIVQNHNTDLLVLQASGGRQDTCPTDHRVAESLEVKLRPARRRVQHKKIILFCMADTQHC